MTEHLRMTNFEQELVSVLSDIRDVFNHIRDDDAERWKLTDEDVEHRAADLFYVASVDHCGDWEQLDPERREQYRRMARASYGLKADVRIAPNVIDAAHIARQAAFSARTFGPGTRTAGVLDHITKELDEIRKAPTDLSEWADVIILAFDGAWRTGAADQDIIDAIIAKQEKNESRDWPDWRGQDPDKAIEHNRGGDA
ncbi:dATP/dGTP pyrophosphohydrolase domain-containing protein [Mycolicibacterium porcinum]